MIAHNDEATRALLKFWLEQDGYRVEEAENGQVVVEKPGLQ